MTGVRPQRVTQAQKRYDAAVRDYRTAMIAAAPALRARARRRAAALRLAVIAVCVVALVAAIVGVWAWISAGSAREGIDDGDAAVSSASEQIVGMLTPDPADPAGYVQNVLNGSTGEQHERISKGRDALAAYVGGLPTAPDGAIVSAGVDAERDGSVDVLVVAQAGDPTLIGGGQEDRRVSLLVTMTESGGRWLVADTENVS
ncbi:hypothetical protein [Gordonia zhaorongruii]|uniref:hypothetical protein n=1 Tax=Gordonia zhaorongruii TaxID=2597659 RepID=UPI001042DCB2|nr:hypothetical protein [Gordonia zhaorongruii]